MKSLIASLAFLAVSTLSFADAQEDKALERLVYTQSAAESDVILPGRLEDPHKLTSFEQKLANFPNVNERLIELVSRDFKSTYDTETLSLSLLALALRRDLTENQLARIYAMVAGFADNPNEANKMQAQMVVGALRLFANYPTEKHEDLAVKFVKSDNSFILITAAKTLGAIGTKRSLPVLAEAVEKRKKSSSRPNPDFVGDNMEEALRQLNSRIEAREGENMSHAPSSDLVKMGGDEKASSHEQAQEESTQHEIEFGLGILAALAIAGFLFLLARYRRGSRGEK